MHIFSHPACLKHTPPPDPSFAPKRLKVVLDALRATRSDSLCFREAPPLAPEDLELAHTPAYVADVLRPIMNGDQTVFAPDAIAVSGTGEAALHAAGAVMTATGEVMAGRIGKAFCVVSPGGHHAEADAAMGFCFFNHIALAAIAAQKKMGAGRVAVVDFDAHHGNGTQSLFWNFENRLLISIHEETPLSGFTGETGAWNNILNLPLPKESGSEALREAFTEKVVPKLQAFKPDILFISAGFDMHSDDPLASLNMDLSDYRWLGEQLRGLSDTLCEGRAVAVLEGGYDLATLGECAAEFVLALAGAEPEACPV
jgi:acetoin utilization deacetylase AcuC-like enzyme